jgi:hypothetical protein
MTPRRLIFCAFSIVALYGALHLAGGRHQAGFLSGTPVSNALFGAVYVVTHFAFVVVAPILTLAGLLLALYLRLLGRHEMDTRLQQQQRR